MKDKADSGNPFKQSSNNQLSSSVNMNNLNDFKGVGSRLNSSVRSSSSQKARSINKLQKILNDPNQSNIKTLETVIFEVKHNCFDRLKGEIDIKTKHKNALEKNIELIKSKIKLSREDEKLSFKSTHNLVQSTKHYQAVENRMSHEMMINTDLDDLKVEVSRLKFEYESKMEENRLLRNEVLLEEKNTNLAKEEYQKTNKAMSDSIKEKDSFKFSITQLKKHIRLMKEKVSVIEEKNKDIVAKVYQLSLMD
eukprot:CAMPEP_0170519440 /NCGR_PEP_ID=MMETSP0209-20121228/4856_1 /TAXON_ID=665100 ORGANISM="Litonotus pictus, Strain P1" /NCGR_SAMPLE_ID=MMETSP0209 /ASSEMBLY_ACC=CAM_ASM_000301 /LENGTH=250 /DNA_ID=CAMNT_0010805321 /DNA_START=161 /DNA_END=913 /DNA_ORIENTATION=-